MKPDASAKAPRRGPAGAPMRPPTKLRPEVG